MRRLFALALIVLASGCGETDSATPTPVDQSDVLAGFAAVGEPVKLMVELKNRPYLGITPAIIDPASEAGEPEPLFTVALYADVGDARASSKTEESVAGDNPEILFHKNVVLEISRSVPKERRDRLVAALKSL